jgi:hypothetical protein
MKYILTIIAYIITVTPGLADRPELEFRLGFDYLQLEQSAITGLNGMSLLYSFDQGFYGGASIYSAALGSGGGFFVGGWEVGKHTPITDTLFWDASVFVGGGGGASQVNGDGLMLRPQIHAGYDFGDYRLGAGASWVSVSGSDISTPSFALTLTRPLNLELIGGHPTSGYSLDGGVKVSTLTPIMRSYFPVNSQKRGGSDLQTMHLIGAEFSFDSEKHSEVFIQANGVMAGDAEGYADWILGKRYFWDVAPLKFFVDFGAGIGGGGAVDTGGGLIAAANAGVQVHAFKNLDLEFGLGALTSFNGDFLALTPSARVALSFGSGTNIAEKPNTVRWQAGTGLTQLIISEDFRKPGAASNEAPSLIYVDIDVFVLKNLYFTGQAYTAVVGDAGGFQIGMFGLGYRYPVAERISLSGEILLGAAGGSGVDTRGGLLGGYKVELDYHLSDAMSLTLGLGHIQTLQAGGMHPETLSLGLKFPFTTLH